MSIIYSHLGRLTHACHPSWMDKLWFSDRFSCGRCGWVQPRTGGLLDLPVRTDTSNVVSYLGVSGVLGVDSDPYLPVRCEHCGRLISECRCRPGMDY